MKRRQTYLVRFHGVAGPYHVNAANINEANKQANWLAAKLKTSVQSVGLHRW